MPDKPHFDKTKAQYNEVAVFKESERGHMHIISCFQEPLRLFWGI